MDIPTLLCFFGASVSFSFLFSLLLVKSYLQESLERSKDAMNMAMEARISAESLNRSTVIQRVVEKYNIVQPNETASDAAKNIDQHMNEMLYGQKDPATLRREMEEAIHQSFFSDAKPEDLV